MNAVIQVSNLSKKYGRNTVIKAISFNVGAGEIFALLGANGAGKTTTLECMEGIRKYDGGSIHVSGKMGVQLQSSSLPAGIKGMEAMRLFSKWSKVDVSPSLISAFGIDELRNKQYKDMSTGQKRRLHLALAHIGNPDIIFLDEPTAGLDVEGRVSFHDEIRKLKKQGKTIVMASHDMAEVESLCDRIVILKDGEIAFNGTASDLTKQNVQEEKSTLEQRFMDITGRDA
jgi:ABC-2 type transport system ATP-binding protein